MRTAPRALPGAVLPGVAAAFFNACHVPVPRPGVQPFINPGAGAGQSGPPAGFLKRRRGQAVPLESATDDADFARRTRRRAYDLVVTAPHPGLLARAEAGYTLSSRHGAACVPA